MSTSTSTTFDIQKVRQDFPCLHQEVKGNPMVFLDSAASAQKPQVVLDTLNRVYSKEYANIHRGVYRLSELATRQFEATRKTVSQFLNAKENEIIFTKGATEGINLVAHSYAGSALRVGDEILVTELEHHANIVPWQQACQRTGATLKVAPITDDGSLDFEKFTSLLNENTKIVAVAHISNVLGTVLPIKDIIKTAHAVGAKVLIDACQSVVHTPIDVQDLDCDFLVFSGHKLYGPNGTGVLFGKYDLLDAMPPYQTGGEMILKVDFNVTTFLKPPLRFEAGTPVITEIIALGTAIEYLQSLDRHAIHEHELHLLDKATQGLLATPGFKVIGTAKNKASVLSFVHEQAPANDIGVILDQCGVAVRAGHHCAMPLMKRLGITASARASFALYNNEEDADRFIYSLVKVNKFFA